MIEDAKVDGKSVLYSLNAPRKTCNNGKPGCKVVRNLLLACFTRRVAVLCHVLGGCHVPGCCPVDIDSDWPWDTPCHSCTSFGTWHSQLGDWVI
jgi:hypothetical protein